MINISTVLRILFGLLFIIAALFKLYPVEHFEILLVKTKLVNWSLSPILARLIIGYELLLGLLLLFNVYLERTLIISLATIFILSGFLIYVQFIISDSTSCGCFGSILPMTPIESLLKNLFLFIIGIFLLFKSNYKLWYWAKFKKPVTLILCFVSLSLPFILSRVDFPNSNTNYTIKPGMKIELAVLENARFNKKRIDIQKGRKLICFYSITCSVCKMSASKISLIHEQGMGKLPIYIVLLDHKDKAQLLPNFIEDTNIQGIPYTILPAKDFFKISDNSIPFLMYLDNGKIKNLSNYQDMSPEYVINFLEGKE